MDYRVQPPPPPPRSSAGPFKCLECVRPQRGKHEGKQCIRNNDFSTVFPRLWVALTE